MVEKYLPQNASTFKELPRSDGASFRFFEKNKLPNFKYYYHGTFKQSLDGIEKNGFKFREYNPNLSLSPSYGFSFTEREVEKGPAQLKNRGKHHENRNEFVPEEIRVNDSVLLVIEPGDDYAVYNTPEGRPNAFSSIDQIPEDINSTIRTRIWKQNQYAMSKESFGAKSKSYNQPGLHLNKKRLASGEWVDIEKESKIIISGVLPSDSVKMIIRKDPKFESIFLRIKQGLREGNEILFNDFIEELVEYFKNGSGVIKNNVVDLRELAENMVMGELENFIVTEIRKIYVDVEQYKGKKLIEISGGKEIEKKISGTREGLLESIKKRMENLLKINPENEFLKRYIKNSTNVFYRDLGIQK